MASSGKNLKITVDRAHRATTRRLFTEILGCSSKAPVPDLEVYQFDDGFGLGAYYVDASEALAPSEQLKAPWLEFLVDDPDRSARELAALGIEPFEYSDKNHRYFCAPGGPVFRLAKR